MAIATPITDTVVQNAILHAAQNVCRIMLKQELTLVEATTPEAMVAAGIHFEILGSVGFAGDACGIVYLCLSDHFALHAVQHVLGNCGGDVGPADLDLVKDVVGELTNMTAGGFKNTLCDIGYPCKLSLPTIARGENLRVSTSKGVERYIFVFNCAAHRIIADIQLRAG